ncbi:MAG: exonuclease domain-containing protein [Gammaproteobacteria bacterium]|nr:exonuclease domain-containing protein [Gammaproteobacteria bacterium]
MSVLYKLFPRDLVRKILAGKVSDGAFKEYLKLKVPGRRDEIINTAFIAVDFETTGLSPAKDNILSVGYTVIRDNRVVLKESGYLLVRQEHNLHSENVAIHQITDTEAEQGVELQQALDELLVKMSGKVLLAHHADIELGFLNAACLKYYGYHLPVRVVDTMLLEKNRLARRHAGFKSGQLRLFNIRKAYGLPRYKAHNALEDAVATAELFLAMLAKYCDDSKCRLNSFL